MQNKVDFLKIYSRPNTTDSTKYSWDKRKDNGNGHSNSGGSSVHPWQGCLAYSLLQLPIARSWRKPEAETSLSSGVISHHIEISGWRAFRDEVHTLFRCRCPPQTYVVSFWDHFTPKIHCIVINLMKKVMFLFLKIYRLTNSLGSI